MRHSAREAEPAWQVRSRIGCLDEARVEKRQWGTYWRREAAASHMTRHLNPGRGCGDGLQPGQYQPENKSVERSQDAIDKS